jgi:superfamily II DNA or RNA helicase
MKLAEKILMVLKEASGLKAKEIALRIGQKFNETVNKKEINRILYTELKGQVIYNSEYLWTLVNGVKKNDSSNNLNQRQAEYLKFLLYLHDLTKDKFVAPIENKLKQFSVNQELLPVLLNKKIIISNTLNQKIFYKWDDIPPNIYMVNGLLLLEDKSKVITKSKPDIQVQKIDKVKTSTTIIANTPKRDKQVINDEGLRPYQIEGRKKIFQAWGEGKKRSVLFQMPTGTGKTVLFSEIVRRGFVEKRKILIVVHRREIIKHITAKLREKGIKVGHILAGTDADYSQIVQVASIQTLNRRKPPEADLIIIDECHHAVSKTYKELWKIYPFQKFLGVTATPIRLNGEGFEELFDELIVSMQIQDFIKHGFLVPIIHYVSSLPDLSGVKISKGDYDIETLSSVMMANNLMYDIVKSYENTCKGKSAIVFAVDVEHSKEIAYRYNSAGIRVKHIDAKTSPTEREQILIEFKQGKIKVICNVGIITEGFDYPECEVVQLARPTQSLSLYLQMAGRVMRTASNKKAGIILDNAGLWREHGLTIRDRQWSLKGTKKKKKHEFQEIGEAIIDENGVVRDIGTLPMEEIKGRQLVPLTYEVRRLLVFEEILNEVVEKDWKLSAAHYRYINYLNDRKERITNGECDYIEKRMNYFNTNIISDPYKKLPERFLESRKRELGL